MTHSHSQQGEGGGCCSKTTAEGVHSHSFKHAGCGSSSSSNATADGCHSQKLACCGSSSQEAAEGTQSSKPACCGSSSNKAAAEGAHEITSHTHSHSHSHTRASGRDAPGSGVHVCFSGASTSRQGGHTHTAAPVQNGASSSGGGLEPQAHAHSAGCFGHNHAAPAH